MKLWHYNNPHFNHLKVGMRVKITRGLCKGLFGTLIDEEKSNILLDDGNKYYALVPRKDGIEGEFEVVEKLEEVSKVAAVKKGGWGFE